MSMALAERHREQAQSAYQKAERLNRLQSILTMAKEVASAASVPIAPGIMAVAAGIVKLVLLYPKATEGMFTLGARAGTIACSVADVLSLSDRHRRPRNVGPSLLPILVRVLGVFQDVEDFIQEEIGRTGFNRIYNRMFKVADTTRELKNRLEDSLKAFSIAAVADSNARGVEQAQYDGEFRLVRTADVRATRLSTIIQRTNVLGEQLVCRPVTMVTTGELLVMKTWKYTELCGPTESDELLKQMSADPEQLHPFIAQYFGHSLDPAQAHHYIVAGHQSATSVLSQNANPVHRFQETFELVRQISNVRQ
ncbi:hypothetical protein BKA62DRAFT_282938 [Auriculariales sp. MPI-PUGE-AT-0066]|nr:hypothetical protein BKA62DRAFT_282938 [Auriculariales sp. MPI-PUGE-AT-0066]